MESNGRRNRSIEDERKRRQEVIIKKNYLRSSRGISLFSTGENNATDGPRDENRRTKLVEQRESFNSRLNWKRRNDELNRVELYVARCSVN